MALSLDEFEQTDTFKGLDTGGRMSLDEFEQTPEFKSFGAEKQDVQIIEPIPTGMVQPEDVTQTMTAPEMETQAKIQEERAPIEAKVKKFGEVFTKGVKKDIAGLVGMEPQYTISELKAKVDQLKLPTITQQIGGAFSEEQAAANKKAKSEYFAALADAIEANTDYVVLDEDLAAGRMLATDEDGNKIKIDSNFVDDLRAQKSEIMLGLSAAYGAAKTAKTPQQALVRGVAGGVLGSVGGSSLDILDNAIKTGIEIDPMRFWEKGVEAATLEPAGVVGAHLLVEPIAKGVQKISSYLAQNNIDGAVKYAEKTIGVSPERTADFIDKYAEVAEVSKFKRLEGENQDIVAKVIDRISKDSTTGQKLNAVEAAVRLSSLGEREASKMIGTNERLAKKIMEDSQKKLKAVEDIVKTPKAAFTETNLAIKEFEDAIGADYETVKKTFVAAVKGTFDTGIQQEFRTAIKAIEENIPMENTSVRGALSRIENTFFDAEGLPKSITIDDAMKRYKDLNKVIYNKSIKDFDTNKILWDLKDKTGQLIEDITRASVPKELADSMLSARKAANTEYSKLFEMQEGEAFKRLTKPQSDENFLKALGDEVLKIGGKDFSTPEIKKMLNRFSPEARETAEKNILKSITTSATKRMNKTGLSAVDFDEILTGISKIDPAIFQTQKGKESHTALKNLSEVLRNDFSFVKAAVGVRSEAEQARSKIMSTLSFGIIRVYRALAEVGLKYISNSAAFSVATEKALMREINIKDLASKAAGGEFGRLQPKQIGELRQALEQYNRELAKEYISQQKAKMDIKQIPHKKIDFTIDSKGTVTPSSVKDQRQIDRLMQNQEINQLTKGEKTLSKEEIDTIVKLTEDDKFVTMSRTGVSVRTGKATESDYRRLIEARNRLNKDEYTKALTKAQEAAETQKEAVKQRKIESGVAQEEFNTAFEATRQAEQVTPSVLRATYGDALAGGIINGVEFDENGMPISVDPEKFVIGLVGGRVAGKIASNKNVQKAVTKSLEKMAKEGMRGVDVIGNKMLEKYPYLDVNPKVLAATKSTDPVQQPAKPFFSKIETALNSTSQKTWEKQQLQGFLEKHGVKAEEMRWSGLHEYVKTREGKISTKELLDEIQQPRLEKKVLGARNETLTLDYNDLDDDIIDYLGKLSDQDRKIAETMMTEWDRKKLTDGSYEAEWDTLTSKYPDLDHNIIHDVGDALLDEAIDRSRANQPKYKGYTSKDIDGTNYREELTTLSKPQSYSLKELTADRARLEDVAKRYFDSDPMRRGSPLRDEYKQIEDEIRKKYNTDTVTGLDELISKKSMAEGGYTSSHWDEPNVLYHVRKQDTTINGDKTLMIEEVQSDWHQAGRKSGYKDPAIEEQLKKAQDDLWAFKEPFIEKRGQAWMGGMSESDKVEFNRLDTEMTRLSYARDRQLRAVPPAPYSKTWHEKAMKDQIAEAVEKDYDRVAWIAGKEQADRYSLAKQVDEISYTKNAGNTYGVTIIGKDGTPISSSPRATPEELSDLVGKEMAEKIVANAKETKQRFTDLDLEVGGEGMKGFYDKMLPKWVGKYIKKYGSKVEIEELKNGQKVWSFEVTDKMKSDIKEKGQPLYSVPVAAGAAAIATTKAEASEESTHQKQISTVQKDQKNGKLTKERADRLIKKIKEGRK